MRRVTGYFCFLARVCGTGGGVEPLGADGVPSPAVREPLPGHAGLHADTAGQPAKLQPGEKFPPCHPIPSRPLGRHQLFFKNFSFFSRPAGSHACPKRRDKVLALQHEHQQCQEQSRGTPRLFLFLFFFSATAPRLLTAV